MISKAALLAWILSASVAASDGARRLAQPVAAAMADEAIAASDDDATVRALAAIEVALAWYEGGNLLSPVGSNDGGASACWGQVYLPHGARTREGWTANELRTDPRKCAHVVVRLVRASLLASPACDECGLTVYSRGRDTEEGRRLSRVRMSLAHRLLRDVPFEVTP